MGHSQTSFARTQNLAATTVGRWESVGEPGGITLAMLEKLATKEGHKNLAKVFSDALAKLKSSDPSAARSIYEERERWVRLDLIVEAIQDEAKVLKEKGDPAGQRICDACNDAWEVLEQIRLFSWRDR